jgi:MFS family permease
MLWKDLTTVFAMTTPNGSRAPRPRAIRRWLGAPVGPIALLGALNMADEFDRIAFSTLSPEIRNAFGIGDGDVLLLNVIPGIVILLTAGVIGWLADRYSRVSISIVAAVAWGAASILTGVVTVLALLLMVRIFSGLGRAANEIVHPSLIADLYPEPTHPRAYLIHRLGNPLAQVSGVAAGFIAARLGWQKAFFILAIPTIVLTFGLTRLKDPGRRGSDIRSPISLPRAVARLAKFGSFPRLWVAAIFLGGASFGIFGLASLYFERIFDLGPKGRGLVQFLIGTGWFVGVIIGGWLANRATISGRYRPLVQLAATSFLLIGIAASALAVAPHVNVAFVLVTILALGNGVWQSPFFSVVAKVAPSELSGQAFGSSATAYAIGGFLTIAIAKVADHSTRSAFYLVAAFGLCAAAASFSVGYRIQADIELAAAV